MPSLPGNDFQGIVGQYYTSPAQFRAGCSGERGTVHPWVAVATHDLTWSATVLKAAPNFVWFARYVSSIFQSSTVVPQSQDRTWQRVSSNLKVEQSLCKSGV